MSNVRFEEEGHKYILTKDDGREKELVSVTTLLKKHGLSPDYSNVTDSVLETKAERGTVIHKELSNWIEMGDEGFTNEVTSFKELCERESLEATQSETMVWNDEIAGTIDVLGYSWADGKQFIGDFKTTATLHKESVAWQLSLYAYLMKVKFDNFYAFHFNSEGECKMVEIQPVAEEEIERLLECERKGEIYPKKTLELDAVSCEKILTIQQELKSLDDQKKELELAEAELKNMLIEKMEETGVKSIDNEYFKITYVAPSNRETIDSAKLKREMPEIAKQFMKTATVKASVRITLKGA